MSLDPGAEANIFEFLVASPQGCGAPAAMSFNQSGTLAPGFYSMEADVRADGTSQVRSNGFAAGSYEFRLLLDDFACTIQITQPGQTTEGTSGNDVICGSSGDDTIFGLDGNDRNRKRRREHVGCDYEGLQRCCHFVLQSRGCRAGGPFFVPRPGSFRS